MVVAGDATCPSYPRRVVRRGRKLERRRCDSENRKPGALTKPAEPAQPLSSLQSLAEKIIECTQKRGLFGLPSKFSRKILKTERVLINSNRDVRVVAIRLCGSQGRSIALSCWIVLTGSYVYGQQSYIPWSGASTSGASQGVAGPRPGPLPLAGAFVDSK